MRHRKPAQLSEMGLQIPHPDKLSHHQKILVDDYFTLVREIFTFCEPSAGVTIVDEPDSQRANQIRIRRWL